MIPPPRKQYQEENVDSWLMSYADMITLLLGFFVIFVSVSEPKKEKLNAIKEGVAGQFVFCFYVYTFSRAVSIFASSGREQEYIE